MSDDKGGSGSCDVFVSVNRSAWIACADRMPPTSARVFIWRGGSLRYAEGACTWDQWTGARVWLDDENRELPTEVTHWMPLPEEPK